MFYFFKKKAVPVPEPPKCNCGVFPDSTWTQDMFLKKQESMKLCPVHKNMGMMMVVTKHIIEKAPAYKPHAPLPPEPVLTPEEDFAQEIRAGRFHLLNCLDDVSATDPIFHRIDDIIEMLEDIIKERK
jgi:hypothetical protein